ncbi:hypothetical protein L873DRAFT_1789042 [Choiromyces venosus 120613-1]|uniref:Uncharacterized protein n=1 Tax=Choiromyces venosus 120613-1 TaxID=1336337 RepID=A0A3N4JTU9_9PEZI|nr:hypothetical protein L873DRAFT_1789042 [Choiromyces venosus 120613-1]
MFMSRSRMVTPSIGLGRRQEQQKEKISFKRKSHVEKLNDYDFISYNDSDRNDKKEEKPNTMISDVEEKSKGNKEREERSDSTVKKTNSLFVTIEGPQDTVKDKDTQKQVYTPVIDKGEEEGTTTHFKLNNLKETSEQGSHEGYDNLLTDPKGPN